MPKIAKNCTEYMTIVQAMGHGIDDVNNPAPENVHCTHDPEPTVNVDKRTWGWNRIIPRVADDIKDVLTKMN